MQSKLLDLDVVQHAASQPWHHLLHSITSLLLRPSTPHLRRYGALGEVEEALKRKLQEQPKDMMLREEVSLGYPR